MEKGPEQMVDEFYFERIRSDAMKIYNRTKKTEMLYVGKEYGDVERVIDILKWMQIDFRDLWAEECNKSLKKFGIDR